MIRIEGVQANGHSPNPVIRYQVKDGQITEIKYGQSLIEWQAVTRATRYKILYKPLPAPPDYSYRELTVPASRTSTTVRGIIVEDLYELKVEAYRGNTLIGRSNTILVFATDDAFEIRTIEPLREVAGISIAGYLHDIEVHGPIGYFSYVLCDSTLLPDNLDTDINELEEARKQIEEGIKTWGYDTDNMVSYSQELESELKKDDYNPCDEYKEALLTEDEEDDEDIFRFIFAQDKRAIIRKCLKDTSLGCALNPTVQTGEFRGRRHKNRIFIWDELSVTNPACSDMLRVVTHEAGHIYGLKHAKAGINSFMSNELTSLCDITNRDVVAIKAIYQSR